MQFVSFGRAYTAQAPSRAVRGRRHSVGREEKRENRLPPRKSSARIRGSEINLDYLGNSSQTRAARAATFERDRVARNGEAAKISGSVRREHADRSIPLSSRSLNRDQRNETGVRRDGDRTEWTVHVLESNSWSSRIRR